MKNFTGKVEFFVPELEIDVLAGGASEPVLHVPAAIVIGAVIINAVPTGPAE